MLGQLDVGVQYQSVGESPELSDLAARIIGCNGKFAARCHVNIDDGWQFCSVTHDLLATPRICIPARAKGRRRQNSQDRPIQPPLYAVSAWASTASGGA